MKGKLKRKRNPVLNRRTGWLNQFSIDSIRSNEYYNSKPKYTEPQNGSYVSNLAFNLFDVNCLVL